MVQLFVIDTVALISYFSHVFHKSEKISNKALKLIKNAFDNYSPIRLSIPSIVFVEIFEKWLNSEEFVAEFKAQVFGLVNNAPHIEIKPIEHEVLENFILLEDKNINLENHDRIILASAMMLQCPLITCDTKIIKYVNKHKVIPTIIT